MQSQPASKCIYNDFQPVSNNFRTESRITSDRREDKCIRRRYQSLHESIDSIPDDRSTIRHSIYNKHQTCTAVCRQVVHESKCTSFLLRTTDDITMILTMVPTAVGWVLWLVWSFILVARVRPVFPSSCQGAAGFPHVQMLTLWACDFVHYRYPTRL